MSNRRMIKALNPQIKEKLEKVKALLQEYSSVIVAYSGGVDSSLLCSIAKDVLGDQFLAMTATSEISTEEELQAAINIAQHFQWPHRIIQSNEMENPEFIANQPDRCKVCKDLRFKAILKIAQEEGYKAVLAGDNFDDLKDYRPGYEHAKTLGIKSPLLEATLTKKEIRELAEFYKLPNHNKPANPCLATRFPYGASITAEGLQRVEESEMILLNLGYSPVRIRHYQDLAKIEIDPAMMLNFLSFHASFVTKKLKELGYIYVTLDLQGYRMGSLNEGIVNKHESR